MGDEVPLKRFWSKCKYLRCTHAPILLGIVPLSTHDPAKNSSRAVNAANSEGMIPESLVLYVPKLSSFVSVEMAMGNVPDIILSAQYKNVSEEVDEISLGIVQEMRFWCKDIVVS